ncbi:MAG: hypothetical protein BalsKO_27810 [Balneolaceae bacterium]
MKYLILFSLIALNTSHKSILDSSRTNSFSTKSTIQNDPINLEGIQDSILISFNLAFSSKNPAKLDLIGTQLDKLAEQRDLNIVHYWRAYQGYYKGIYLVSSGEINSAEKLIDQQIDLLSSLKNKGSEEYALLGLIRSFSIQFKTFIRAPFISNSASGDVKKALELDDANPRAFYVSASSDYYTPKNFGGGKKVEELLLKVLGLPIQKVPNPVLPSWGKLNAYELLLQFYIREGETKKALNTLKKANASYPNNYRIQQIAVRVKEMQ